MSRFPHCALVRSYVLNNLESGPARVADLVKRGQAEFNFSHAEIEAAAKHFAVVTQVKKGEIFGCDPPICLPFGGAWVVPKEDAPRAFRERLTKFPHPLCAKSGPSEADLAGTA